MNRPVFICVSEMSSGDESALSPVFGALSSKDYAPVTPIASKSDSDGGTKKKVRQYKFPRVCGIESFRLRKAPMLRSRQDLQVARS